MSDARLPIAVGVIFNRNRDRILLSRRAAAVHQGGLWEFPGGKCRRGEDLESALKRELYEELNLEVDLYEPLLVVAHDYPDLQVELHVWSVLEWHGEVYGKEGQTIEWVSLLQLPGRDFPGANSAIVSAIMSL